MSKRWFKFDGIMAWVTVTAAILVGLSIVVTGIIQSKVVNQAGAHDRQVGFLRISEFLGNMIGQTGGIRDHTVLQELIKEVRELRPGIQRLSVFEITPGFEFPHIQHGSEDDSPSPGSSGTDRD